METQAEWISRSSQCHPRGELPVCTIGLLLVMVLGDVGMSLAGWISALSLPGFGVFIISGWVCECLTESQWLPGQVDFFKIRCVKSLVCYLLCELIGSAFAKFCVHAVVRAGCSEQTCGTSFAAASVSHSFPGSSPGPPDTLTQLMERGNTCLLGCTGIECKLNQTPGDGNGIKSGLQSNDSNWLWRCREKGSLEPNRNLQKDHCATCLCCGTLRKMKLRFSCHCSTSEHFIHCFHGTKCLAP